MSNKFYTKVKASTGFWKKIIEKQLEGGIPFNISNKITDELTITSNGKTALDEIIKLSIEYPMEVFNVKIETDDVLNNYVYIYECSKGESKLVKEGYEYYFKLNISEQKRIDTEELNEFKRRTVHFFKHNEHFLPKEIAMDLNEFDFESSNKWSVAITYETQDVRMTACKKGLTCINIDVEFPKEYDDLPF